MDKLKGVALVIALLVSLPTVALADSPHFISASDSINSAGALVVSFKEAGLGTVPSVSITVSASGTAVYACINNGGNHPKATNKETVSGPLSASGNFPVRNGQTTGSLTVGPVGPGSFSCPSGQNLVLSSVSYSSITVSGLGASTTVPNISKVLFPIP